jgi:hypothetical protein
MEATPTDTTTLQPQASEQLPAPLPPTLPATAQQAPRITADQLMQLPESKQKDAWIDSLMQAEMARLNYAQDRQYAIDAFNSGQFDDLKKLSAQQGISLAIMKQGIGRDWGLSRADAIRSVVFINGKPSLENELVASRLQQSGVYWDIEWLEETGQFKGKPYKKCIGCTLWLKRWDPAQQKYVTMLDRNSEPVSVSFTEADAANAKIWENGKQIPLSEKWNFQSWARDMYYWKCIARVKKYHAPNVLRGGVPREDAYEVMPVESMPPELLPPDLQPAVQPEVMVDPQPETTVDPAKQPRKLRDRILDKQESLLDSGSTYAGARRG